VLISVDAIVEFRLGSEWVLTDRATAGLPLEEGAFNAIAYHTTVDRREHVALVHGEIRSGHDEDRVMGSDHSGLPLAGAQIGAQMLIDLGVRSIRLVGDDAGRWRSLLERRGLRVTGDLPLPRRAGRTMSRRSRSRSTAPGHKNGRRL
jgi:GTP cyclohydrolase II